MVIVFVLQFYSVRKEVMVARHYPDNVFRRVSFVSDPTVRRDPYMTHTLGTKYLYKMDDSFVSR